MTSPENLSHGVGVISPVGVILEPDPSYAPYKEMILSTVDWVGVRAKIEI